MVNRRVFAAAAVALATASFFVVPVAHYGYITHRPSYIEGYDSLSCIFFGIGVNYGYDSALGNQWVLNLVCGIV